MKINQKEWGNKSSIRDTLNVQVYLRKPTLPGGFSKINVHV